MEQRANRRDYLGILVCKTGGGPEPPFGSRAFYRRITVYGKRAGLNVYVFAPDWIDWGRRLVHAYAYDPEQSAWRRAWYPFPRLVYDRAFCRTRVQLKRHRAILGQLLKLPGVTLLGRGLGGKLQVHRLLQTDPAMAAVLPETEPYTGPASLRRWLDERGEAVLKPQGGTHGKGVFRIRRCGLRGYEACGRTFSNHAVSLRFPSLDALRRWADLRLIAGRPYLIQTYLDLNTAEGAPFDIRALVQKNGRGCWSLTGLAARIGPAGGLTSNLHGGGTPVHAREFLQEQFGIPAAETVIRAIRQTALAIPPILEGGHGPLLELGIDFGVDRFGRAWVLEVNSKPGRASFIRGNDKKIKIAAITRPIRYARYVLDRQLGGQIDELDIKQSSFYEEVR